jgi:hypothetical protein
MKNSTAFGLMLISVLLALAAGAAFAEDETNAAETVAAEENIAEIAAAEGNVTETVAAEESAAETAAAEENETAAENETAEESSSIEITGVNFLPPEQYVTIKNSGTAAENMTAWALETENTTIFAFPAFELPANSTVSVYLAAGENNETSLYTNDANVTLNIDEWVALVDAEGEVVSEFPTNETA